MEVKVEPRLEAVVVGRFLVPLAAVVAGVEGHREVAALVVAVLIRLIPLAAQEARAAMGP